MKTFASVAAVTCFLLVFFVGQASYSDKAKSEASVKKSVVAQADASKKQKSSTKEKPSTKKPKKPRKKARGRLPNNFGKLGLSNEQRNTIYDIQAKYKAELAELQKKIDALKEQRDTEIESVLTDGQKTKLAELREASKKKRASRKKSKKAS